MRHIRQRRNNNVWPKECIWETYRNPAKDLEKITTKTLQAQASKPSSEECCVKERNNH